MIMIIIGRINVNGFYVAKNWNGSRFRIVVFMCASERMLSKYMIFGYKWMGV
jgi:hypothetical protein